MQNSIRNRTKEYFPTVLLTLLSIVQAIALELLWGVIVDEQSLYEFSITAVVGWIQISASLLGIILIWVVYAGNVMRFRWVPNLGDSVYPFLVGILEFWLVASIGEHKLGFWLIALAGTFALMTWVGQITMRRARFDSDNDQFFRSVQPATFRDFLPQAVVVAILIIGGATCWLFPPNTLTEGFIVTVTLIFLVTQYVSAARYWESSMTETVSSEQVT